MLPRIVKLATLVNNKLAYPLQLAANQRKEKIRARCAVSRTVSGGSPDDGRGSKATTGAGLPSWDGRSCKTEELFFYPDDSRVYADPMTHS